MTKVKKSFKKNFLENKNELTQHLKKSEKSIFLKTCKLLFEFLFLRINDTLLFIIIERLLILQLEHIIVHGHN